MNMPQVYDNTGLFFGNLRDDLQHQIGVGDILLTLVMCIMLPYENIVRLV